jgi:hypothetical protein
MREMDKKMREIDKNALKVQRVRKEYSKAREGVPQKSFRHHIKVVSLTYM